MKDRCYTSTLTAGLGLHTKSSVKLTSGAHLHDKLLGQVIDEKLVIFQLARCVSPVVIRHVAPFSMAEDLGMGVLLCKSRHGR